MNVRTYRSISPLTENRSNIFDPNGKSMFIPFLMGSVISVDIQIEAKTYAIFQILEKEKL